LNSLSLTSAKENDFNTYLSDQVNITKKKQLLKELEKNESKLDQIGSLLGNP